jgi:hypothetical protein
MSKSNKKTFDDTYSGAQAPPLLPSIRGDPEQPPRTATTLAKYRDLEDEATRERRLRALWKALPSASDEIIQWNAKPQSENRYPSAAQINAERIEKLRNIYNQELMNRVGGSKAKPVDYNEFVKVCTLLVLQSHGRSTCFCYSMLRRKKRNFGQYSMTSWIWTEMENWTRTNCEQL